MTDDEILAFARRATARVLNIATRALDRWKDEVFSEALVAVALALQECPSPESNPKLVQAITNRRLIDGLRRGKFLWRAENTRSSAPDCWGVSSEAVLRSRPGKSVYNEELLLLHDLVHTALRDKMQEDFIWRSCIGDETCIEVGRDWGLGNAKSFRVCQRAKERLKRFLERKENPDA